MKVHQGNMSRVSDPVKDALVTVIVIGSLISSWVKLMKDWIFIIYFPLIDILEQSKVIQSPHYDRKTHSFQKLKIQIGLLPIKKVPSENSVDGIYCRIQNWNDLFTHLEKKKL